MQRDFGLITEKRKCNLLFGRYEKYPMFVKSYY